MIANDVDLSRGVDALIHIFIVKNTVHSKHACCIFLAIYSKSSSTFIDIRIDIL